MKTEDEFARLERMKRQLAEFKAEIDAVPLSENHRQKMDLWFKRLTALIFDREALYGILDIIHASHSRMSDIVGTADDEVANEVIKKCLEKKPV